MRKALIIGTFIVVLIMVAQIPAHALSFGFGAITANSIADPGIGESQLSVDVTSVGSGQVSFVFNNAGPEASSITDVYFDDGTSLLSGIAIGNESSGVSFSLFATPGNLPGRNNASPSFATTSDFSADSNSPVQPNGVNPGEYLQILFNGDFDETSAALGDGSLRIGIHVQGFTDGQSESFVNRGTPVPEPATILLISVGLLGVAGANRIKSKKNKRKYQNK
jgi:hypothetical protein